VKQNHVKGISRKTFVKDAVPGDVGITQIGDRRLYMIVSVCVTQDKDWTALTFLFCDGKCTVPERYNNYWTLDIIND
jgi:hypothetical protein